MKKNKFILGVVACAFAALAMTGCSLTLGNSDDRVVTSGYKLTSISLDTKNVTKDFIRGAKFSYEGLVVNGTYADNSTKVIKEYTVSTPNMNKCEEQTVTVTAADNATATYKITVSLPVKSIDIKAETYKVTATYEDGSTKTIPGADIEWSYDSAATKIVATYLGKTAAVAVPKGDNIKKAYAAGVSAKALYAAGVSAKALYAAGVSAKALYNVGISPKELLSLGFSLDDVKKLASYLGLTGDKTGGQWWTVFTEDKKVESGKIVKTKFKITGDGQDAKNFNIAPDVILRKQDKTEFGVFRADNFGWLYREDTAGTKLPWVLESNWDWDSFVTFVAGSTATVYVSNNGDGTADLYMDFEKDSTTKYQNFKNIVVDSNDLYFAMTLDGATCSITFTEN